VDVLDALVFPRNNKNIIVEDLYVGNTLYEGDNIFKGWHEHSHNLAQPADNPDFDTRFKQQCQQDYITIKSIYDKIIPKVVTMGRAVCSKASLEWRLFLS
jgi:hypothetical protein